MASVTEFDYLVVGAGSAGCVVAARLSEDSDARVLLLEAGGSQPLEAMAIPLAWPTLQGSSADWADETVPQTTTGLRVSWPRGRGLGGSSSINAMNFLRGHHTSYDSWNEAGVEGWGYDDLLPYFQRSEDLTGVAGRDSTVRGLDGPLRVGPAVERHPVAQAFLAATLEAGYTEAEDLSSGLQEGFGWTDLSIADGTRQDGVTAYLRPAMDRPNLHVVTDALVHRVMLDGNRCTGVEYSTKSDSVTARCSGEVVLCAGAVGSPQLLMLSGIGPQDHLSQVGVSTSVHLPGVGTNLQDHPISGIVYQSARPVPTTLNNHAEMQGLIRSSSRAPGPDLQFTLVDLPLREDSLPGPDIGRGYTIMVALMTPFSRGTIRLASPTPGASPIIDPRYYSDDRDIDRMVRGLRVAREIGSAPALGHWREREALPGPDLHDEDGLRAYLFTNLRSYSHYVGTCRIGVDGTAVVDPDLRVHGVSGLRVADASVMPSVISANTNATVYAIAERAAELVRTQRSGTRSSP
ncbi:GMC family oxidoreductase N-terminal domain-containing protein [Streptomyces sp900116325]|uniref:GMC family oxidoreductase n=1 Tax=Streptomyces sp. 900116325 TaxID=3154295 RepID=UPI003321982A